MKSELQILKKFYPNAHPDFYITVDGTTVFHITDGMGEFISILDGKAYACPYVLNHKEINKAMGTKVMLK